jgi:hypothetical protein
VKKEEEVKERGKVKKRHKEIEVVESGVWQK